MALIALLAVSGGINSYFPLTLVILLMSAGLMYNFRSIDLYILHPKENKYEFMSGKSFHATNQLSKIYIRLERDTVESFCNNTKTIHSDLLA